jgi:hypothetical protein
MQEIVIAFAVCEITEITDLGGRLMGKRSNFARREADFYPTPRAAVVPLVPHLCLGGIRTFAEPCAGEGDLVRHLESFGLRCVYSGDIYNGQDALALDNYGTADAIISNPPYTRELMHRLISHFQCIAPTWLLLELDWSATKQAAEYMRCCSDIVTIGRVKWIVGSKHTGKDNHAWFRFDIRHKSGPVFHGRGQGEMPPSRTRVCEQCGKRYEQQRSSSRFCSETCRQRAHRQRLSVTLSVTPAPAPNTSIEQSDSSEVFRYVRHADVPRFTAEGWEPLPALDGTHHGEYSVLMRRVEQG